ncbi:MAG TPA: MCE family protein [Pseudonocardia sp.]|jgi:virulence factor Mce-like protein
MCAPRDLLRVFRAAAAVLLLAAVLAGTAGCGLFGEQPIRISALFGDAVGLYEGNNVAVLGIKVGTVRAIHPEGTHVRVDMDIDPDVKIPANAGAVTLSPSVVTDRRVELTPAWTGGPTIRDGDLIPLDRTRTPVEIDRLFTAADRLATQLNKITGPGGRPAVADALGVTADTFAGNGEKLRTSLHGLAAAVGVGADQRDQLADLIRDVDHLTQLAADNDGTVRSFSHNLTEATALADQQGPAMVAVLDNLTVLLDRADRLIRDNRAKGEDTLANLRVTAHTLAGRERELAEAADVLPTAFQNLNSIIDYKQGRARVHAGIDELLLDTQLLGQACRAYGAPALCPGNPAGQPPNAGLALLMLGGAR